MSVQHPLLQALKDYARRLFATADAATEAGGPPQDITDDHPDLPMFCATIDKILHAGLKPHRAMFSRSNEAVPSAWAYMQLLGDGEKPGIPFAFRSAVFYVKDCHRTKTAKGKLRLLIRSCLTKHCLQAPLEQFTDASMRRSHYTSNSVIGDEILLEMFLSIIRQIGRLTFSLNLDNNTFLDTSWYVPTRNTYQLVPCSVLGLRLTFVDMHAIIADILPNSVVAEIEDIEVGDILEEINGSHIVPQLRGRLKNMIKTGPKQPVQITIIKAYYKDTGKPYPAMIRLLRDSNIDLQNMHLRRKTSVGKQDEEDDPNDPLGIMKDASAANGTQADLETQPKNHERPGYPVNYVGAVQIGKFGGSNLIGPAIEQVLKATKPSTPPQDEAIFECQEIGVRVSEYNSPTVLFRHTYMEITACSQSLKDPNYFAYIAGEKPCNLATMFTCYVFHSSVTEHVLEILISIGQGFKRTHFAV